MPIGGSCCDIVCCVEGWGVGGIRLLGQRLHAIAVFDVRHIVGHVLAMVCWLLSLLKRCSESHVLPCSCHSYALKCVVLAGEHPASLLVPQGHTSQFSIAP